MALRVSLSERAQRAVLEVRIEGQWAVVLEGDPTLVGVAYDDLVDEGISPIRMTYKAG